MNRPEYDGEIRAELLARDLDCVGCPHNALGGNPMRECDDWEECFEAVEA